MGFTYCVCICNILAAIGILAMWIRESKKLPIEYVKQLTLRYARFYLVFAMMMNRFIRYQIWSVGTPGNSAVPYWPLTKAEIGIIFAYLALCVISLVMYHSDKAHNRENGDETGPNPFNLVYFLYPVMMPGLKITKGKNVPTVLLSSLSTIIWLFGFLNILLTTVFSFGNPR